MVSNFLKALLTTALLTTVAAYALVTRGGQTTTVPPHSITLTVAPIPGATGSPTYSFYRAQAPCLGATSFANLGNNLPVTYTDSTVSGGLTYCFFAIDSNNVPTPLIEILVPSDGAVKKNPPNGELIVATVQ